MGSRAMELGSGERWLQDFPITSAFFLFKGRGNAKNEFGKVGTINNRLERESLCDIPHSNFGIWYPKLSSGKYFRYGGMYSIEIFVTSYGIFIAVSRIVITTYFWDNIYQKILMYDKKTHLSDMRLNTNILFTQVLKFFLLSVRFLINLFIYLSLLIIIQVIYVMFSGSSVTVLWVFIVEFQFSKLRFRFIKRKKSEG